MRKKDGVMVPLVLLPMNAKKKDIQKLVNDSLIAAGEKEISTRHSMQCGGSSFLMYRFRKHLVLQNVVCVGNSHQRWKSL